MNKKQDNDSLWLRSEYEVLSEIETEKEIIGTIRNLYNGTVIICSIPKHIKEEQQKITEDLTYALTQIAYTGQDISNIKKMEIIKDLQ